MKFNVQVLVTQCETFVVEAADPGTARAVAMKAWREGATPHTFGHPSVCVSADSSAVKQVADSTPVSE